MKRKLIARLGAAIVAQTSSLLYRGFPIRKRRESPRPQVVPTVCRLEVGDTAGWKPALRLKLAAFAACGGLLIAVALAQTTPPDDRWVAPPRAAARKNPVAANDTSIALGKNTYARHCLACHGKKGKGDGPTAGKLEKHPRDLSSPTLWEQSDGALLWKVTEGHKPMPTFKNLTSDEERWPLINYIRTLASKPAASSQPKAEKPNGETKP